MCTRRGPRGAASRWQGGLSLIELIVFIVIVSAAVAGVLAVFNVTVRSSADPLIRKQLIAVAESLLEEVTLQALTYCDPDDGNVRFADASAVGAGNCTALAEAPGAEAGESRYSTTTPFDNVNDYAGFTMNPIRDLQNLPVPALAAYSASVAISDAGPLFALAAGSALRIDVTVSGGGESLTLGAYRFRYAPNVPQ